MATILLFAANLRDKMAAFLNTPKIFRLSNVLGSYKKLKYLSLIVNQRCSSGGSDPKQASITTAQPETPTKSIKPLSEPVKGKICEKKPVKVVLQAGQQYLFCACGYSKNQPFCDSSHKAKNFSAGRPHHFRYQPLPFTVEETKEFWLCLCKQSKNRPFCDGTHKRPDIQAAVLI